RSLVAQRANGQGSRSGRGVFGYGGVCATTRASTCRPQTDPRRGGLVLPRRPDASTGPLRMAWCGDPAPSESAPRRTPQRPRSLRASPRPRAWLSRARSGFRGSRASHGQARALPRRSVPAVARAGTRAYSNRKRCHPAARTQMVASTKSMLSVFRPRALHLAMRDDGARPPMPARAPSAARRRTLARAVGVCVACVALSAPPLAAQLRPLEPLDWGGLGRANV